MKKALVLVLSILLVFSLTIPAIAAVPRATNRVDVTVQSHSLASIGTPLSMEADEERQMWTLVLSHRETRLFM